MITLYDMIGEYTQMSFDAFDMLLAWLIGILSGCGLGIWITKPLAPTHRRPTIRLISHSITPMRPNTPTRPQSHKPTTSVTRSDKQ